MLPYVLPFVVYAFTIPLATTPSLMLMRVAGISLLLLYFHPFYRIKFKVDTLSLGIGFLIAALWVGLEGLYPQLGSSSSFIPPTLGDLMGRLILFIILAPVIEEFFVRNFLARYLINQKWEKVPLGKFSVMSFIITVAFFGFSHNRWLPGIIAGILLNWLIMKRKNMSSVVIAHGTANSLLAGYILYTHSWHFW